jgi:hypothetical protein
MRSHLLIFVIHSSSERIATRPVEKRLGLPATVWLASRSTSVSVTNGVVASSRPACARICSTVVFGAATNAS